MIKLVVGHCGGMGRGGDFSFHDHSEAGTIDAEVRQQSAHTPKTNATAALPRGVTLERMGDKSGRGGMGGVRCAKRRQQKTVRGLAVKTAAALIIPFPMQRMCSELSSGGFAVAATPDELIRRSSTQRACGTGTRDDDSWSGG